MGNRLHQNILERLFCLFKGFAKKPDRSKWGVGKWETEMWKTGENNSKAAETAGG